ncbi:MAG: phosphoribosylglycinamide formyltransferase [Kistimonas sp.]|nr:phosphoribosylglycinamide formyltransferase [Kistimonas sp.]
MTATRPPAAVVVLISGNGSNLQALIDSQQPLGIRIAAVISNCPDAFGLQRASEAGIPARILDHRQYPDRTHFDTALTALIDAYDPSLVVLAGFMRILLPTTVAHYQGRMLNIHPSLLPRHKGLHTHRRVLEAGDRVHGATVHFVTAELDAGAAVIQARIPVRQDDTEADLQNRVQAQERLIYPKAVHWHASGRLQLKGNTAVLDGTPLPPQGVTHQQDGTRLTLSPV